MENLTKDAKIFLNILYKIYLERIKNGSSKVSANCFENSPFESFCTEDKILSQWHDEDIDNTIVELATLNYITCSVTGKIKMTNKSIIYFENAYSNVVSKGVDVLIGLVTTAISNLLIS